jgi:hypothetical protein
MKQFFIYMLVLALFSSCKTTFQIYDSFFTERDEAIKAIERLVKSQGEKFTPNSVEVNIEFIAYSKEQQKTNYWAYGGWGGGTSTVNQSNAIYYDMIDDVKFIKKKGHYEVRILQKSSKKWKIFFCWDKDIAQAGADGFAYMRNNYGKAVAPTQSPENSNKYEDLEKLKGLLDSGVINQEEFDAEKQKILSRP